LGEYILGGQGLCFYSMFKQIFGHNKIWGILHPNAHPWLLGPGNVCGGC